MNVQSPKSTTTLKTILSLILKNFLRFERNTPSDWLTKWFSQSSVTCCVALKIFKLYKTDW